MKVTFIGASDAQVNFGGDDPRGLLRIGKNYTVIRKTVEPLYTEYTLKDFPKLHFNSVCFETVR
jgi:hypothetical protein